MRSGRRGRLPLIASLSAIGLSLGAATACAGDTDPNPELLKQQLVPVLLNDVDAMTPAEAECAADIMVDSMGSERLVADGANDADSEATITANDVATTRAAFLTCLPPEKLYAWIHLPDSSDAHAACVIGALPEGAVDLALELWIDDPDTVRTADQTQQYDDLAAAQTACA